MIEAAIMTGPVKRILVPVDFSDCSRQALEYALDLAGALSASVDVLHAWTLPANLRVISSQTGETLEDVASKEAARQMSEFMGSLAASKKAVPIQTHVKLGGGGEADVIVEAAKSYDLVVMGTNGRSGVSWLVTGSVAEKVVRRSTAPVLTVRLKGSHS